MTTTSSNSNEIVSYNGQVLNVDLFVYQVAFDEDKQPYVVKYQVLELLPKDKKIKVQWFRQNGTFDSRHIDFLPANQVHTDPVELIDRWLKDERTWLELLPKRIDRWLLLKDKYKDEGIKV